MNIKKISDYCYEIPKSTADYMRVDARFYASEKMLDHILGDNALQQICNVAAIPGIVKYSLAMPDIHWGYGFPIGGVAATDIKNGGVISPGGIGYDCNCGVRLLRTDLEQSTVQSRKADLCKALFSHIPTGVGSTGTTRLTQKELKKLLRQGSHWAVKRGQATEDDIQCTENFGRMEQADPATLSPRALERGLRQIGTLGSGNHFIEVQLVEEIFNEQAAEVMGLHQGQITIMIHTGSRGLGYQVCDDYLRKYRTLPERYGFSLPDRQLVCGPLDSKEGWEYFAALSCAANFAWANRQILSFLTREVFERFFGLAPAKLNMKLIYDVAHNIAKIEDHLVDGQTRQLCVHRKGATRAFPAGHKDVPAQYRSIGQPVIVPGDMGSASYVLVGSQTAMEETFGSVCHGAGRVMSRTKAIKTIQYQKLMKELDSYGVSVCAPRMKSILEEAPQAYKDITQVIDVVCGANLAQKVARMRPLCVIKG